MRKNLLLLTCTVLVLTTSIAFAGGQKDAAAAKKGPIQLSFWSMNGDEKAKYMQKWADDYSIENPGVKITYVYVPWNEYTTTKLTTAFASGEGPDIFDISPGDLMKYVNSGIALDITSYFSPEVKSDFLKPFIDAVTVKDKIYGVPRDSGGIMLFYNEDMLKSAGIAVPETWDEWKAAARELTTPNRYGVVLEVSKGYYLNYTWYPFLWQGGGEVLDLQNKKSTFNSPAAAQALDLWAYFIKNNFAPPKSEQTGNSNWVAEGRAAMMICGSWEFNKYKEGGVYQDRTYIKVANLPIPKDGIKTTCWGGWKFIVNARGKNPKEAAKYVMWLGADLRPENTQRMVEWCSTIRPSTAPRKSVQAKVNPILFNEGIGKEFIENIYPLGRDEPRFPAEIVDIIGDAIQNTMFKGISGKEAAEAAHVKINDFLKTFKGEL